MDERDLKFIYFDEKRDLKLYYVLGSTYIWVQYRCENMVEFLVRTKDVASLSFR